MVHVRYAINNIEGVWAFGLLGTAAIRHKELVCANLCLDLHDVWLQVAHKCVFFFSQCLLKTWKSDLQKCQVPTALTDVGSSDALNIQRQVPCTPMTGLSGLSAWAPGCLQLLLCLDQSLRRGQRQPLPPWAADRGDALTLVSTGLHWWGGGEKSPWEKNTGPHFWVQHWEKAIA